MFDARDVVRFVYGDVRPWAEDLGRKKEYAALAAIFHVRKDDSVPFQLESRREAAEGILAKAGREAVPYP